MPCKGVVAAGHELTVEAAETVLREGGNAFDAILAAHFAACVSEPVLASLGGGGYMIARPAGREAILYDFFVQTPRRKRPVDPQSFYPIWANFGTAKQEFHIGQGTIATPGSVKGAFAIHRELGSMPMARIVAPAVRYARDGVTLNRLQAYIFSIISPIYLATPESRAVFCSPAAKDRMHAEGETLRQPELAETIERIAAEGERIFYRGDVGRAIVEHCREAGGHLTCEDLEQYEVVRRKPLEVQYGGAHVTTNPPPSSGGILIAFALELLRDLKLAKDDFGSYAHLRLLAEVMALTNQARVESLAQGDGQTDAGDLLLNPEYLERYRREIAGRARAIRGTTHIGVIDAEGNVAAMTVSNGEGCGSIVPGTGIMLNNMLGEQDLNIDGFHRWEENRRMTSMMAPSLIRTPSGALAATGSGGSNRIRTALLQVIMNLIHFEMDASRAVLSSRIHLEGGQLSVEGGFASKEIDRLIKHYPKHHVWPECNLFFGGANTVMLDHGEYSGAGDPRRGGVCRVVE